MSFYLVSVRKSIAFMNLLHHIKLTKTLLEGEIDDLNTISRQALDNISSESIIEEYVMEILDLFHKAFNRDDVGFIEDIFFENQLMIRRTLANQNFIFDWFEKTKPLADSETKQIQLVHVYRAMVSDVFEPYLSILVASIHLIENTFDTFLQANLGTAEFNKQEFIKKRLKGTNLLSGYFPIIRNAVSHAGSHSIQYEISHIIFKKIKRGTNPTVDEVLKVNNDDLILHIQSLIDFTQCVDVAINIFGIDANDLIMNTPRLAQTFYEKLFTQDSHVKHREIRNEVYRKIWLDDNLTNRKKHKYFGELFSKVCRKYKMPAKTLRFIEKEGFLIVSVPYKAINLNDNQAVIQRVSELIRYCLLAYQYFHFQFDSFFTEEEEAPDNQNLLQIWLKGGELKLYSEGQSTYLDLIHDANIYKNKTDWPITVDFDTLRELDLKSLKEVKKRKQR